MKPEKLEDGSYLVGHSCAICNTDFVVEDVIARVGESEYRRGVWTGQRGKAGTLIREIHWACAMKVLKEEVLAVEAMAKAPRTTDPEVTS